MIAMAAVTRTAVQSRLPLLPSFELSEPTARRNPPIMFPMTPVVWPPTVLRDGPWPFFSRFFVLELFFWYRFDIRRILPGIDARVNCFSRG